jgi:hypothetical protein
LLDDNDALATEIEPIIIIIIIIIIINRPHHVLASDVSQQVLALRTGRILVFERVFKIAIRPPMRKANENARSCTGNTSTSGTSLISAKSVSWRDDGCLTHNGDVIDQHPARILPWHV